MRRTGRWAAALAIGAVVASAAPALAAPAELDSSFGDGGVATIPLDPDDGLAFDVTDAVVDGQGRTVVLGGVLAGDLFGFLGDFDFDLAFARLLPDGRLDGSFGSDGVAHVDLGGFEIPGKLALDGDGRILASATRLDEDGQSAVLVRLTPDGAPDPSFASGGTAELVGPATMYAGEVVVDASGRPAVAVVAAEDDALATASAEVHRFTVSGQPDPSLGGDGSVIVIGSSAGAFALSGDGAGGYLVGGAEVTGPFVARIGGDGALVPSFGNGGIARVDLPTGIGFTVERLDDGQAVLGGWVGARSGFLARLGADGRLDPGFGLGGVRTVRDADAGPLAVESVAAGPAGTLAFTGSGEQVFPRAAVGRVLASGAEDAAFGADGYVHPLDGRPVDAGGASALAAAGDGRLVVAGLALTDDRADGFAARLRAVPAGSRVGATTVRRVAGTDRVATAVELSRRTFAAWDAPAGRPAGEVVLAAADRFPDALVAVPYAAAYEAPVLLNPSDRLDDRVRGEIARVVGDGGLVTIMGGVSVVSPVVEAELRAAGFEVDRIAGNDRYDTSVRVARLLDPRVLVLARGDAFPDALAGGPAAAETDGAVLLTAGREMPASVAAYLDGEPEAIRYAIGGQAAAADPDATPVAGVDRYDTAARVAQRFFRTPPRTVVASGERFPDALAGGALAALSGSPLVLATGSALPAPSADALARGRGFHRVVTLAGGTAVLDEAVRAAVQRAVG